MHVALKALRSPAADKPISRLKPVLFKLSLFFATDALPLFLGGGATSIHVPQKMESREYILRNPKRSETSFFWSFLLGPCLRHMEVSRLGVQLEL